MDQFDPAHRDIAARLLDVVEYLGGGEITAAYRNSLAMVGGWHINPRKRRGKWRFAPFGLSSGTSADTMIHAFRLANDLDGKDNNELFIRPSEIPAQQLGYEDTLVFVEDLAATGDQVCESWGLIQELTAGIGRVFLLLVLSVDGAQKRIRENTPLRVIAHRNLNAFDNIFSEQCAVFTKDEKDVLHRYGLRADRKYPRGYGNCGLVVVFQHRCPNNSVPVLHASSSKWTGLFPRK